jgi:hypothetical protein
MCLVYYSLVIQSDIHVNVMTIKSLARSAHRLSVKLLSRLTRANSSLRSSVERLNRLTRANSSLRSSVERLSRFTRANSFENSLAFTFSSIKEIWGLALPHIHALSMRILDEYIHPEASAHSLSHLQSEPPKK